MLGNRRECPSGMVMSSNGICQPILRRNTRDETCQAKGDIWTLTQDTGMNLNHCFNFSCQELTRSQVEAWVSSCSCASWGDNYPCGNLACGSYYIDNYWEGSNTYYCDGPPMGTRSEWRKGGKITKRKGYARGGQIPDQPLDPCPFECESHHDCPYLHECYNMNNYCSFCVPREEWYFQGPGGDKGSGMDGRNSGRGDWRKGGRIKRGRRR